MVPAPKSTIENGQSDKGGQNCTKLPVDILKEEVVFHGKFIKTLRTTISIPPKNKDGKSQIEVWETVQRLKSHEGVCGIFVVPILQYADGREYLVSIKQFRICMKGYCLELPGGHVDSNESSEQCAIRELREETGYTGTPITKSDGISVEACSVLVNTLHAVIVRIDGDDPNNHNVKPQCPEGENELIEVVLLPMNNLLPTLKHYAENEKLYVTSELYMIAFGKNMHNIV